MKSQPLFLRSDKSGGKGVGFGPDRVIEYDTSAAPADLKTDQFGHGKRQNKSPYSGPDDDEEDDNLKTKSKKSKYQDPKYQDPEQAIDFKNNRNQKLAIAAIAVSFACFTLLGLFAFGGVAIPVIKGFGIAETILGIGVVGGGAIVASVAIAGSGISKQLPNQFQEGPAYDGMISLSEQKRMAQNAQKERDLQSRQGFEDGRDSEINPHETESRVNTSAGQQTFLDRRKGLTSPTRESSNSSTSQFYR